MQRCRARVTNIATGILILATTLMVVSGGAAWAEGGRSLTVGEPEVGFLDPGERWSFDTEAGQLVRVTAESVAFDTKLEVRSSTGELLAENDDCSFDTTDSCLEATLPVAGRYEIRVTAFLGAGTGVYTVAVQQVSTVSTGTSAGSVTALAMDTATPGVAHEATGGSLGLGGSKGYDTAEAREASGIWMWSDGSRPGVSQTDGYETRPIRPLGPGGSKGYDLVEASDTWSDGSLWAKDDLVEAIGTWSDGSPWVNDSDVSEPIRPLGPGGSKGYDRVEVIGTWSDGLLWVNDSDVHASNPAGGSGGGYPPVPRRPDPGAINHWLGASGGGSPAFNPHGLDASGDGPAPWDPPPFNPHGLDASGDGPDPRQRPMGPGGSPGYSLP